MAVKRDELNDNDINTVLANNNASSFKYKASIIGNIGADERKNGVKTAVPLKYLSNFWRSLEMPLINCKVDFSLDWYAKCIIIMGGTDANFVIRDAKLYVPNLTLKTEDNAKLWKLLHAGFKKSVYWNKYKIIFREYSANENIRERLDDSLQGVRKLFVVAYQRGVDNYLN